MKAFSFDFTMQHAQKLNLSIFEYWGLFVWGTVTCKHGGIPGELCIAQVMGKWPALSSVQESLQCSPLKETRTNEMDLVKLLSVRNGVFKRGETGQEPPCHLAVICGIDSGLWLDLKLSTAEVQVPWPQMECLLHHRRSRLPVYEERMVEWKLEKEREKPHPTHEGQRPHSKVRGGCLPKREPSDLTPPAALFQDVW